MCGRDEIIEFQVPDGVEVLEFHARTKMAGGRDMAVGSGRAQKPDADRLFECKTAAHDLPVNGFNRLGQGGATAELFHPCQDSRLAVRGVDRTAGLLFVLADIDDHLGAGIDQFDQLTINFVDLLPQFVQIHIVLFVAMIDR